MWVYFAKERVKTKSKDNLGHYPALFVLRPLNYMKSTKILLTSSPVLASHASLFSLGVRRGNIIIIKGDYFEWDAVPVRSLPSSVANLN